jgi:nicotinamidase-related amidase
MSDWMPRYKLRRRIPCVQGTGGEDPDSFAVEKPGEKIIFKQSFDGFHDQELLEYLRKKNKRFVITAGLVTSTCVLFTTTSAIQKGFLTAVVDDCCADTPLLHEHTLEKNQFIFDRTTLDTLCEDHAKWLVSLEKLALQ